MFSICSAMKWTHLPNGGGIYNQDPAFLDGIRVIFSAQAEHDEDERRRGETRHKAQSKGRRVAGHR